MKKTPGDNIILHMCTINDILFLKYGMWWTEFVILDHDLPFYPTNDQENQNFEKMKNKKKNGDIILDLCTTCDNHIM